MRSSLFLRSWMELLVYPFQARTLDMRVDLRRRDVRMPQKLLHHAQIGAILQKMRGERMPQNMRINFFSDAGLAGVLFEQTPHGLARHAPPQARHEKRIVGPLFCPAGP